MLQTQSQHVFSHQHQYPQADSSWLQHQQQPTQHHQAQHQTHFQQQQQQQHPSTLAAQQHAQAQAAAAAAVAQHQHYSRIANAATTAQPAAGPESAAGAVANMDGIGEENRKVLVWVTELLDPNRREAALMELSKKREQVPDLALVIWHSFGEFLTFPIIFGNGDIGRMLTIFYLIGVMTSLLQEIISVYPLLNPSQLTAAASNRVCNALALLQCVASHTETRTLFLNGNIPLVFDPLERLTLTIWLPSTYSTFSVPIS